MSFSLSPSTLKRKLLQLYHTARNREDNNSDDDDNDNDNGVNDADDDDDENINKFRDFLFALESCQILLHIYLV